jgi:hypothetical protein
VDDSAFGGFIDCRNKRMNLIRIRVFGDACPLLQCPKASHDATVAQMAAAILVGAFGGGLSIGHRDAVWMFGIRANKSSAESIWRPYARGLFWAVAVPLFRAGMALFVGWEPVTRAVLICSNRA